MNNIEWQQCSEPELLLEFVQERAGSRKLRGLAVACCRRIWKHFNRDCRRAVDVAAGIVNGSNNDADRRHVAEVVRSQCLYLDGDSVADDRLTGFALEAALCTTFSDEDHSTVPNYAAVCAAATMRAVREVIYAEQELNGKSDEACDLAADQEQQWQCDTIRRMFDKLGPQCDRQGTP